MAIYLFTTVQVRVDMGKKYFVSIITIQNAEKKTKQKGNNLYNRELTVVSVTIFFILSSEMDQVLPINVQMEAKTVIDNLLPDKSRENYERSYNKFLEWGKYHAVTPAWWLEIW